MALTEKQYENLFETFVNIIFEKCANEIGIPVTELKMRYTDDKFVKDTIDVIIRRSIKRL